MFEKKMTFPKENIKFLEVSPEEFIFFFRRSLKCPSMFKKKNYLPKEFFWFFEGPPFYFRGKKLQPLKKILTPLRYLQKISFFKPLPKGPSILEEMMTSIEVSPKKIYSILGKNPLP